MRNPLSVEFDSIIKLRSDFYENSKRLIAGQIRTGNLTHQTQRATLGSVISKGDRRQNFDRDARPIFLGLKFGQILFFWVGQFFSYFSGFRKISVIFWV